MFRITPFSQQLHRIAPNLCCSATHIRPLTTATRPTSLTAATTKPATASTIRKIWFDAFRIGANEYRTQLVSTALFARRKKTNSDDPTGPPSADPAAAASDPMRGSDTGSPATPKSQPPPNDDKPTTNADDPPGPMSRTTPPRQSSSNNDDDDDNEDRKRERLMSVFTKAVLWMATIYGMSLVLGLMMPRKNQPETSTR